jgi:acetate kinase
MKVLVLGRGSSSVKFQLVETDEDSSAGGSAILRHDAERNEAARGGEADVAPPAHACRVQVIPTNEELLTARDTYRIVRGLPLA